MRRNLSALADVDGHNFVVWIVDRQSGKTPGHFAGNGRLPGQLHFPNAIGIDTRGSVAAAILRGVVTIDPPLPRRVTAAERDIELVDGRRHQCVCPRAARHHAWELLASAGGILAAPGAASLISSSSSDSAGEHVSPARSAERRRAHAPTLPATRAAHRHDAAGADIQEG